jgi:predicted HTH transcriptional regulator
MIGINERLYAYDKNKIGINYVKNGIPENNVGVKNKNIGMLTSKLKQLMNKCTVTALSNTAKTLAQLYTNPKCSQKDLLKLTKLSLGGISKHIKALKTRNLIIKVGFQQYALSDISMKMLQASSK